MKLDNFILGHNSFFGINHANYEKGKNVSEKFKNNYDKIVDILLYAKDKNINNFMLSTLDESEYLLNEINKTPLKESLNFYVLLPYINKYVRKSNEVGILGLIQEQLKKAPLIKNISYGIDLSTSVLRTDFKKTLSVLIDIELQAFANVKKKIIILHDALTDILISLKREDVINYFIDYIKNKYKCDVGFATKNFPSLNKFFGSFVDEITILTHANSIGFNMNPGKEEVEKEFLNSNYNMIFMSILASGFLDYKIALDYLKKIDLKKKKEFVIGCSSKKHIDDIYNYLKNK